MFFADSTVNSYLGLEVRKESFHVLGDRFMGYILILGNLIDISHPFQVATDGPLIDTIFDSKLIYRLLAIYIICYYL